MYKYDPIGLATVSIINQISIMFPASNFNIQSPLALVIWVAVAAFIAPCAEAAPLHADLFVDSTKRDTNAPTDILHFETHDEAWKAIGEAKEKGNVVKGAYISSSGTLISNIKFEEEKQSKRFDVGGFFKHDVVGTIRHYWPGAGKVIPGITFTEHQVIAQGTYFTDWEPSSCPFYNDKSTSDVRHDFTTTITKSTTIIPGFDLNLAGTAALKIGAEITKTNTLTRLDSYTIKAGTNCQTWVRPLMLWQNQQTRDCKKTSLTSSDKTCTGWGKVIQAIFLVQNKTIGNLRCGEANILRNKCGS